MIRPFIITVFSVAFAISLSGQSFGIRAGLNYNKFSGPIEAGVGEKFSFSNGFHFGVNYAYKFADNFGVKGEIVYTQIGSKYDYNGESFYKVPLGTANYYSIPLAYFYEKGNSKIDMKISNAYISMPITFQWQASRKFEFNVGVYASVLIGPKGSGTLKFVSSDHPDSLFFRQSLIHKYGSDKAGGIASGTAGAAIFLDGSIVYLPRDAGAYYNYLGTEKSGNLYKSYDYGLTGAVSYYINKGFYVGLRYDFGLVDVTNNEVDYVKKSFDKENNKFILSKDFDRNVGFEISLGFRF